MEDNSTKQLELDLRKSETALAFLRKEHEKILEGLHEEIATLTKKCSDLQFQLALQTRNNSQEEELREIIRTLTVKVEAQNEEICELREVKAEKDEKLKEVQDLRIWEKLQLQNQVEVLSRQLSQRDEKLTEIKKQVVVEVDIAKLQSRVSKLYEEANKNNQIKITEIANKARSPDFPSPRSELLSSSLTSLSGLASISSRETKIHRSESRSTRKSLLEVREEPGGVSAGPSSSSSSTTYSSLGTKIADTAAQPIHHQQSQASTSSSSHDKQFERSKLFRHHVKLVSDPTAGPPLDDRQQLRDFITIQRNNHHHQVAAPNSTSTATNNHHHHHHHQHHLHQHHHGLGHDRMSPSFQLYTHANPPLTLSVRGGGGGGLRDGGQTSLEGGAKFSSGGGDLPDDYKQPVATLPPIGNSGTGTVAGLGEEITCDKESRPKNKI